MKKTFLLGAIAAALFSTSVAAADLPKRTAPVLPAPVVAVVPQTAFFVGVHSGYAKDAEEFVLGATVGYDFGIARLEAAYDRFSTNPTSNVFTANAILENTYGSFTPYVLAGAGFALNEDFDLDSREAVYNAGFGTRVNLGGPVELDARVRYLAPADAVAKGDYVGTLGVNVRF